MKKKILILGCTGSIGTSALKCMRSHADYFEVVGLSAHSNEAQLQVFAKEFGVSNLCLSGKKSRQKSSDSASLIFFGETGLKELISSCGADIVLNGISGAAGLMPSIETLKCGCDLALANKETIVTAGNLVMELARKNNCSVIPVDSEHSAVFNLIERFGSNSIDSVILTASGGAFKNMPTEKLAHMKAADALKHPTWNMGQKITVDSATLANKGLEVIEACRLFNLKPEQVKVVVHPQSLVHSFIRTKDGVLYAQMSKPDMVHPILSALFWPDFLPNNLEQFDPAAGCEMTFLRPRYEDFPLLDLAYEALKLGSAGTIAYNAANEEAVSFFLKEKIGFCDIALITKQVLQTITACEPADFEEVFIMDAQARITARTFLAKAVY